MSGKLNIYFPRRSAVQEITWLQFATFFFSGVCIVSIHILPRLSLYVITHLIVSFQKVNMSVASVVSKIPLKRMLREMHFP